MSFDYGCNTRLVTGFIALLRQADANQLTIAFAKDASRLPAWAAMRSEWQAAYHEAAEGLRRTNRMTAAGNAWLAVREALGNSAVLTTARWVSDALCAWDLITHEQRVILWRPFAHIAPLPGTERAA